MVNIYEDTRKAMDEMTNGQRDNFTKVAESYKSIADPSKYLINIKR